MKKCHRSQKSSQTYTARIQETKSLDDITTQNSKNETSNNTTSSFYAEIIKLNIWSNTNTTIRDASRGHNYLQR